MLVDFDKHERKMQRKVIRKLGEEEILSQLSEECSELAQAAQKLRRVLHGTTFVSVEDARDALEEEVGDVLNMIDYAEKIGAVDLDKAMEIAHEKSTRWYIRTVFGVDI